MQFYTQMQVPIHKEIRKNKELEATYLLIVERPSDEKTSYRKIVIMHSITVKTSKTLIINICLNTLK